MDVMTNRYQYLRKVIIKAFLYLISIVCAISALFPLVFALVSSFKPDVEIYATPFSLPNPLSLKSYLYVLTNSTVPRGILNSFIYTVFATLLTLLMALLLGYFVTRFKIPLAKTITLYFLASLTLPIHASLIPLSVIINKLGIKNSIPGIVILYAAMHISYAFFIISGYMKSIPKELDESAIIDGCGPLRMLFSIIMPLAKPAIVTTSIIVAKGIYNDLIFGAMAITQKKFYTLSLSLLIFNTEVEVKVNVIYSAVIMSIIPVLIFYFIFQKKIEQGLTAGAVKG